MPLPKSKNIMLKRLIIFIGLFMSIVWATYALAQDTNSKPSPTPSANTSTNSASINEDKVKALKEKLATKVAELTQNQTRGFYGEIASLAKNSFTLAASDTEIKIRFDENTLIYKLAAKKTEGKTADLKNMVSAAVLGLYDESTKQQSAKFILLQDLPKYFSGKITQIDKNNNQIEITDNKTKLLFDYEATTQSEEYNPAEQKIRKSGFSKLKTDDFLQIWAIAKEDDTQKYKIVRLLRIPSEVTSTPSPTASASAKTTPVKNSPGPSPKASAVSSPQP